MFSIISLALIFIISISLHEYAHARASNKLGDPTPKLQWRLTPNPLKHIDPIWFFLIFIINFWRWRPVIINPAYYKNPRRDELLVALAWPATNLLLACAGIVFVQLYIMLGSVWIQSLDNDLIFQFWKLFSWLNVSLAIFNLLPFPPLDWYRIVSYLVPWFHELVLRYGTYMSIAVIAILVIPNPISSAIWWIIWAVSQFIFSMLWAFRWIIFL
jgi:Zn-dependent protease